MEKYREGQRTALCFFGPGKSYDKAPREELWYCIRKSQVAEKYVKVVQGMYVDSVTNNREMCNRND